MESERAEEGLDGAVGDRCFLGHRYGGVPSLGHRGLVVGRSFPGGDEVSGYEWARFSRGAMRNPYSQPLLTLASLHARAVLSGDTKGAVYLEKRWRVVWEKERFWEMAFDQMKRLTVSLSERVK
jgi:hypothetical protein